MQLTGGAIRLAKAKVEQLLPVGGFSGKSFAAFVSEQAPRGKQMSKKSIFAVAVALQCVLLVYTPQLRPALASSYDDFGLSGSLSGTNYSSGTCEIFTGPRQLSSGGSLGDNEFLLTISNGSGVELSLQGTFKSKSDGQLELSPNRKLAESSFTEILQAQAGDPTVSFELHELTTSVKVLPDTSDVEQADCGVHLTGDVTMGSEASAATGNSEAMDDSFAVTNPVTVDYKGLGRYFAGVAAPAASAAASANSADSDPVCNLPSNLQPNPQPCSGTNCLLDFAGYKWWTYNQYYSGSGFWNNNNVWSPRNATVDAAGLHLFVRPDNIGNGTSYMAAEVVLLENPDSSIATLGFGTYLVTANVNSAPNTWNGLDPNVAFGAFNYEKEQTGTANNPFREIDLAEISRWGHPAGQPCEDGVPVLCEGNAQFTLQRYAALPDYQNIRRYTISSSANQITLVMEWDGADQPVTFKQYNGAFTLATLPSTPPDNQWTTAANQNPFIPANGCQKFHLNFWMGNFAQAVDGINPPPSSPQEVVVTNFQYQPLQ
jgi:hypothetical protein